VLRVLLRYRSADAIATWLWSPYLLWLTYLASFTAAVRELNP
jgi:tryptophan-rich sensory protein